MSTDGIDAKKLKESIATVRYWSSNATFHSSALGRPDFDRLCDAAEAHLATLPREVEVVSWATFTKDGRIWSSGLIEEDALRSARDNPDIVAVRLTGTAVLPKG